MHIYIENVALKLGLIVFINWQTAFLWFLCILLWRSGVEFGSGVIRKLCCNFLYVVSLYTSVSYRRYAIVASAPGRRGIGRVGVASATRSRRVGNESPGKNGEVRKFCWRQAKQGVGDASRRRRFDDAFTMRRKLIVQASASCRRRVGARRAALGGWRG